MSFFIGFGSLVNTATHRYAPISPVQVPGWQRAWINNDTYDHAFLSVIPDQTKSILGLLARVPDADWSELDIREAGYHRHRLNHTQWLVDNSQNTSTALDCDPHADVQLYVHSSGDFATPEKPILYSYLATVLFGFYQVFGIRGIENFLQTTTAWTDIKYDRVKPLYPRYVPPIGAAQAIVEQAIETIHN